MSHRIKLFSLAICLLPTLAYAEAETKYVDLQSRYTKMHINYLLNDDFTVEETAEIEIKALHESAVQRLKRRHFSHSTSIEKFEVLEAYTKKADGSHVVVPKDNYQVTINKGKDKNAAIFSDRTRVTIVFPDFELNDSAYMKIKTTETEPMFPGHFSTSRYFGSQTAYDDVKVTFDLPDTLDFKHQARGMQETIKSENGRKIITLTYSSMKPVKIEREDFSVWDEEQEAGYALSTFMDYESLSEAYGARANPKAVPTERIKKLAKKIIATETDQKQQARLLYDWVATNITYAGNCIGVGAVVPHDLDFILDNKMGDCKDHATLLQALYKSIGVDSTQALINAGSKYALPTIPRVSAVNHVINYIPMWDKFVDSTNQSMPFDRLDFSISDKPVILVGIPKPGLRTPASMPGDNYQEIDSTMQVQPDGSVIGKIDVKTKGKPAVEARDGWRHVGKEEEEEWLKRSFSSQNQIGSATMTKDDPTPLTSKFNFSIEFKRPEFIPSSGAGGFYVAPPMYTPMGLWSIATYPNKDIEGYDVACSNGRSVERIVYEFPENIKILAVPEDLEVNENYIHFKATYVQEGNKLKVARDIDDSTPGNVCSAEIMNKQRQTLMKISDNMKSQVVYQH